MWLLLISFCLLSSFVWFGVFGIGLLSCLVFLLTGGVSVSML